MLHQQTITQKLILILVQLHDLFTHSQNQICQLLILLAQKSILSFLSLLQHKCFYVYLLLDWRVYKIRGGFRGNSPGFLVVHNKIIYLLMLYKVNRLIIISLFLICNAHTYLIMK